jgi:prepilin-type processing-associated H-X9-DG protein
MGMGATNTLARVAASIGVLSCVEPSFDSCVDVPNGGVLLALPALLVSGLLNYTEKYFQLPAGYYRLDSIFLLLAFMALSRLSTVEDLRFRSPGEWGKILGLDRIPEAKTLRAKISLLSDNNSPSKWAGELSQEWMNCEPDEATILYVDGHVRVYSGHQTKLPRHYVARQKLCLRATSDYWINAMGGRPFFLINKEIDPGLISVLEEDIIPRLETEVPNQPTEDQLKADKNLNRFTLVFDREGYSPDLFKKMWKKRISCITYRKYSVADWPEIDFKLCSVTLSSGNKAEMKLAEKETKLSNGFIVREIRKLTKTGHQTSILTTDYRSDLGCVAVAMFARWSQENFFKYMRIHYNIDRLSTYSTEPIPDNTMLVNPAYRKLEWEIRKNVGKLNYQNAKYGKLTYEGELEEEKMEKYKEQKAEIQEEIDHLVKEVSELKKKRSETKKHIQMADLPEDQKFDRLRQQSKYFIDTIKMVSYRAETAMANALQEKMSHPNEARTLLRAIYTTEADIQPNAKEKTLTVRLHQLANHMSCGSIQLLLSELNATETLFPGTDLRLVYKMGD